MEPRCNPRHIRSCADRGVPSSLDMCVLHIAPLRAVPLPSCPSSNAPQAQCYLNHREFPQPRHRHTRLRLPLPRGRGRARTVVIFIAGVDRWSSAKHRSPTLETQHSPVASHAMGITKFYNPRLLIYRGTDDVACSGGGAASALPLEAWLYLSPLNYGCTYITLQYCFASKS